MSAANHTRTVIQEQVDYYRKRAPEYDDWFFQRGRYDEGEPRRAEWQEEIEAARAALRSWAKSTTRWSWRAGPGSGRSICFGRRAA